MVWHRRLDPMTGCMCRTILLTTVQNIYVACVLHAGETGASIVGMVFLRHARGSPRFADFRSPSPLIISISCRFPSLTCAVYTHR